MYQTLTFGPMDKKKETASKNYLWLIFLLRNNYIFEKGLGMFYLLGNY